MAAVSFKNMVWKQQGCILPAIGNTRVYNITHNTLDKYVTNRSKSVKMTTVHRELSDIRAILNWSVRRQLILRSPMDGYDMPTKDNAIVLPPSQEEIELIISHSSSHLQRAMLLAYFLGLRPGAVELLSIKYSQINWSAGTLTVISAKKGGPSSREIPIHESLPLRAWFEVDGKKNDGYIITWQGKPIKSLKTAFNAAKRRAGVS